MRAPRSFVLSGCLALLSACTNAGPSSTSVQGLAATPCPSDVEIQLLVRHSCAYLTLPEDRTRPAGRTVSLFVVTITPPDPSPDPLLILGDEIGAPPDYGAHQGEAERLHRVIYLVDERGVGHSRPELSCPEFDRASIGGLMEPTGSAALARASLAAVRACRARLASSGIDPSAYDLAGMAEDVEDLRAALGIESWNLAAYGSLARLAFEIVRAHPNRVRAVYLDSPQFPQLDEATEAALGTNLMLDELFTACETSPACRSSSPDLRQAWKQAIAGLAANPAQAGTELGDVLVDAGAFVRSLRADLASDTAELPNFPAVVLDAAAGRLHVELTTALAAGGSLCAGYRASCGPAFGTGAYLTVVCRDQTPSLDPSAPREAGAAIPGVTEAFAPNPYLSACRGWNVAPTPESVHGPPSGSVPTLLMVGQFDPFSPPALATELSRGLDHAFVVEVPADGHHPLLGSGCQLEVRNRWLDQPMSPPSSDCLDDVRLEFAPSP